MIASLLKAVAQKNVEEATKIFGDIVAERIAGIKAEMQNEMASDMIVSDMEEGFVKSNLLGNIRAAYKIKQHEDKAKLFGDSGMAAKAAFHQKAADRLSAAYTKAQVKEEAELEEISKATLASYIPKAARSARASTKIAADFRNDGNNEWTKAFKAGYGSEKSNEKGEKARKNDE